MKRKRK